VLDRDRVDAVRKKARRGLSIKAIARAVGVSRNTVRGYLRTPRTAGVQIRAGARRLDDGVRADIRRLFQAAQGNATEVHRLLTAHGVTAGVRTVQRAAADLRSPRDDVVPSRAPFSGQETSAKADLELARSIARNSRTHDRDELESELTDYLALLEPYRAGAKNWTGFLVTALTNHAARWLGDQQGKSGTTVPLHATPSAGEDAVEHSDLMKFSECNLVDDVALALVRGSLDTWLARVWDAYIASGFNQTVTAIILGVHRNTVARALARIRQVFKRHGF
jgi:DNA-directed RNA polymerase specialized sigma24 family protein